MSLRERSFQFVENNSNYVVHVTRGQQRRRFEVSRLALFGGAALLSLVGAAVIAAAGYLVFRDDLLAGLIERQTQMQYAYEDRLAAARLRLDQVASRQFIDSDGVEGKVRSLVIRQAMLETRAAVVARLLEHTVQDATGSIAATRILSAPAPGLAAGISTQPRTTQSAIDDSVSPLDGKPRPEGFDLRPGHNPALFRPGTSYDSRPSNSNPAGKGEDHAAVAEPNSEAASAAAETSPALANASDPGLPMPARLESLAMSLDHVERDQATRLSGIVKPALDAAGKLRRAFDVAGLPVERYMAKAKTRGAASAVGGPFVPADMKAGTTSFERELVVAQNAVETLDGLRHALPSVPLRKPLRGELQMTSTFGYRTDPFLGRPALHSGVDLREEWGDAGPRHRGGRRHRRRSERRLWQYGRGGSRRRTLDPLRSSFGDLRLAGPAGFAGRGAGPRRLDRPLDRSASALRGAHRRRGGRSLALPARGHGAERDRAVRPGQAEENF